MFSHVRQSSEHWVWINLPIIILFFFAVVFNPGAHSSV